MDNSNQLATLQVLYDDPDGTAFTYGGGQAWDKGVLPQWYGQTTVFPNFAFDNLKNATKAYGTLTFRFEGTAAAFVGNTPGAAWSQTATVSIDGGLPYNITYPGTPPSYIQWYKTPTLPPGIHTVFITNLEGTALDYAVVDIAPSTNLTHRTIVVDDNHSDIQYSGSWTRDPGMFHSGYLPSGFPFGNGTHRTSNPGDRLTFSFFGSQLKVYDVFNWAQVGVLGAEYTLDGVSSSQLYPVAADSPEHQSGYNDASNFLLFSTNMISPGQHTLIITVTRVENVSFALDFITYTPNFATLDDKPDTPPSIWSSTSVGAGSRPTTTSGTPASSPPSTLKDTTIVVLGSVLGSVVAVALCLLVILFWRQRKKEYERTKYARQTAMFQEGHYPELGDGWRALPRCVNDGFGLAVPMSVSRNANAYLNFGPNTRPTKQGLPLPGLPRSVSDPNLSSAHAESQSHWSSEHSDVAATPIRRSTRPYGDLRAAEPFPVAPPAYDAPSRV